MAASSAQADDFPKRLSEQSNIPGGTVRTLMLSSGVKALIQHVPKAEAVGVSLSVKAGSQLDTSGSWGRAHFLEHLLFRRTVRFSGGKLSVSLDNVGADRGANTTERSLNFWEVVPVGSAELALQIEADRLSGLVFTPGELELERRLLLRETAGLRSNPWRFVRQHLLSSLYPNLHNGELIPDGAASDIARITAQELTDFYRDNFLPSRACVSLITSEPFSLAETRLERHFGKNLLKNRQNWEKQAAALAQNKKEEKAAESVQPASSQNLLSRKEADLCVAQSGQGMIVFAWPAPKLSAADYAGWLVLNVLWADSSEAYLQKVIKEHGLASKVKINYDADFGDSMYVIGAHCTADVDPKEAAALLEEALDAPDSQEFVSEHLEAAKGRALAHFYKLWQNYQDRLSLFEDITSEQPGAQLVSVPEAIDAVSTDSILALWSRLARSHPQTYVSEPAAFWRSFSAAPGPRRVFADHKIDDEKAASAAVSKAQGADARQASTVTRFHLDNGLKVQIWVDESLPIVSMRAFLAYGALSPNQEKLTSAAAELLGRNTILQSGEYASLPEVVEREGLTLSFTSQRTGVLISGWCRHEQLPRLLQLLGTALQNPQFSDIEVEKVLQKYNGEPAAIVKSSWSESLETILQSLYKTAAANQELNQQEISAAELREKAVELIRSSSLSLNFSGRIELEEVKRICQAEFSTAISAPTAETERRLPFKAVGRTFTVEGHSPSPLILAGQAAPPPGHKDYFAYLTALQILGGSSSSRLPLRIVHLEKLGGRASAHDMSALGGFPSWMAVLQVKEGKQDRALAILRQELQRLSNNTSQAELNRAVSACKGRLQVSWSSPAGKAEWLRLQGSSGLSPEEYLAGCSKVSLQDIKRAASVWFNSKNLVIVRLHNSAAPANQDSVSASAP
ncbi:MAG: M16 family metallopeptidase [Candidatus Bruticola sp.]